LQAKRGFTLVELLVVIAVIGVIAAMLLPNAFKSVEKAKVAKLESDMATLKTAALIYYSDTGRFPPDKAFSNGVGEDPGFMTNVAHDPNWDGPYLEQWQENTPFGGKYTWAYACSPQFAAKYPGAYAGYSWVDDDGRLEVWCGSALWDSPTGSLKLPQSAIEKIDRDVDGEVNGNKGYFQYVKYSTKQCWTMMLYKKYY